MGNKPSIQKGESVANNGIVVLLKLSRELEFRNDAGGVVISASFLRTGGKHILRVEAWP